MTDKIFEYQLTFYLACPYTDRTMVFAIDNEIYGTSSPDGGDNIYEIHVLNTKSYNTYAAVSKIVKFYPGNNQIKIYLDKNIVYDRYTIECLNPMIAENPSTQIAVPIPQFTVNTTIGKPEKVFSFSDMSTNEPIEWLWDFGDGSTSAMQNPDHHYLYTGIYTVSLTAKNSLGWSLEPHIEDSYITVTNTPDIPQTSFTASPVYVEAPGTVSFANETKGLVTDWYWEFGDGGVSTDQNPALHTYTKPGKYVVSLTASNEFGPATQSTTITVHGVITTVVFSVDKTSVDAGEIVTFTNTGMSEYAQRSVLDLGNGETKTFAGNFVSYAHVYTNGGTFTPTLTVTDKYGVDTVRTALDITVTVPVSDVSFTIEPSYGTAPLVVKLTNTSSIYNPKQMIMDWGYNRYEGAYTTDAISATIPNPGSQEIRLSILDSTGVWVSKSNTVTVVAPITIAEPVAVAPIQTASQVIPTGGTNTQMPVGATAGYKYRMQLNNVSMHSGKGTGFWCTEGTQDLINIASGKVILPKGYFTNYLSYLFQDMVIVRMNGLTPCNYTIQTANGYVGVVIDPPAGQGESLETFNIFFGKTEYSGFFKKSIVAQSASYDNPSMALTGAWFA